MATTYSQYQLCPGICPGEDTPASPHIKTINAGKLRVSIQRGHEEYIGKYSRQLACGYWLWHYFGSITQRQTLSISGTARAANASRNAGPANDGFHCVFYGEMNDSVDVKRHIYLRTNAKQKVYAEFDLAILSPTFHTSTLISSVGTPPLVEA